MNGPTDEEETQAILSDQRTMDALRAAKEQRDAGKLIPDSIVRPNKAMTADDPLEALRDWIGKAEIAFEPHLEEAFAALETERKECEGDAIGFAQKVDEIAALRAEVLKIAEEAEAEASHCRQPYMARLNGVAERLRKACE